MTTATAVKYEQIKLQDLHEAPYNPRRTFDDEALKELIESVKSKGILNALLVRPIAKGYEVVGGARRFRAAKKAGLDQVPCQVHQFNDDEALEAAIIDNLVRSDMSAVDEAHGFQEMLKRGHKVEDLAKRTGKSIRHIYDRLALQKLAPAVLRALDERKITPSHAIEIAKLDSEESQKKVLEKAFSDVSVDTDDMVVEPKTAGGYSSDLKATVSVRDFKAIVAAEKIGADLLEQVNALKLAGHKAHLISNEGWGIAKQILTRNKWKSQGSKPCKNPAKGVMADEKGRGKVLEICATSSCKRHFPPISYGSWNKPKSQEEIEREKRAEEAKKAKAELEHKIKLEAFRQICNKVREIPKLALAQLLADGLGYQDKPHIDALFPGLSGGGGPSRFKKVLALKPIELAQLAVGIVCTADIMGWSYDRGLRLADLTKDLGIDFAALEKGIRGKFASEAAAAKKKTRK